MRMKQRGLSNRELALACRLEALELVKAAKQLELKANLLEVAETLHDFNAKLSNLCPDYILSTFEKQLGSNGQDREFLAQMCIASSPAKSFSLGAGTTQQPSDVVGSVTSS